jgi:hypothetical protein
MAEEHRNGVVTANVRRVKVPAPAGRNAYRWVTVDGHYLGEVEIFATDPEAAKVIIKDIYQLITGLVLP